MKTKTEKIRVSLDISLQLYKVLERLAKARGGTKSEVLRLGIGLLDIADNAKAHDQRLGLVNSKDELVKELVGL